MDLPNPNWSVYSSTISSLVQTAEMLGTDTVSLLSQVGIDPEALKQSENRFPFESAVALYRAVAQETGNQDVGLYAGRIQYVGGLNIQLYMSTICRTFREYLNLMPSLLRFAGDIGEVKIRREGDLIGLHWLPLWEETSKHRFLSDEVLSNSASIVNSLCIRPIPVIKASFTYAEPEDLSLLKTVFGEDLSFNQPSSCLYYKAEVLDYQMTQTGFDLNQALTQQVEHFFVSQDGGEDEFLSELRECVVKLLPIGDMTIDTVAAQLNVSRRTMQRRLSERETQFSQILQSVRSELALNYLADQRLGVTDIAFLLGYGDQSSFSSAFKSWYGQSPRDYRQKE